MIWLWTLLGMVAGLAGLRRWRRMRALRADFQPRVDDAALRRILETGTLGEEDDEPLDLDEIARAEEDFWSESSWDEPEEYPR